MYISNLKRSVDSMRAGQKLEHSVGHVIVGVIGVVIEGDEQDKRYSWAQWVWHNTQWLHSRRRL